MNGYEKPAMRFDGIAREAIEVSKNCWHLDANKSCREWYYDYGGRGYVSFSMGGNCNRVIGLVNEYYGVPEDEMAAVTDDLQRGLAQHAFSPTHFSSSKPLPGQWS